MRSLVVSDDNFAFAGIVFAQHRRLNDRLLACAQRFRRHRLDDCIQNNRVVGHFAAYVGDYFRLTLFARRYARVETKESSTKRPPLFAIFLLFLRRL